MSEEESEQRKTPSRSENTERFTKDQAEKKGVNPVLYVAGLTLVVVTMAAGVFYTSASLSTSSAEASTQTASAAAERATSCSTGAFLNPTAKGAEEVTDVNGVVKLPIADFADGKARFYSYCVDGKLVPFFIVRGSDGIIRAAFNACDACYMQKMGYHQEGDFMVCNHCGYRSPSARINIDVGGCNPAPLVDVKDGDDVAIKVSDIARGADYF